MGQVTIYLDDATEAKMRAAADGAGMSKSKWIAQLIENSVDEAWPAAVRELAGAWPQFPSAKDLRASLGEDAPRADL